jgi:hypothetical protein
MIGEAEVMVRNTKNIQGDLAGIFSSIRISRSTTQPRQLYLILQALVEVR